MSTEEIAHRAEPLSAASATSVAAPAAASEFDPDEEIDRASIGTLYSFRYPNFRWLWTGDFFTSASMWIQQNALAYVIYSITSSASMVGSISAVSNIAAPVVAPFAGLAADRMRRNTIVAISQFLLFINAFMVSVAIHYDALHVWNLFVFAIASSVLHGFNQPARQAMTFDVVPRAAGPNAIALTTLAFNITRTIGPGVGGALIALFGPAESFLVQSIANLCIMVTVLRISLPAQAPSEEKRHFFRDMIEGYRWVWKDDRARLVFVTLMIYPLFIIPVHMALMVVFAEEVFDSGAAGLGILLSSIGLGGLIGGIVIAGLNRVDRRGLIQVYSMLLCGGSMASFAFFGGVTGFFWVGVGFLVVSGIGGSIFNITNQTVAQLLAPVELRGRVLGAMQMQPLCMGLGTIIAGFSADAIGASATGTIFGIGACVVVLAVFFFSPLIRDLRLSHLMPQPVRE